MGQGTHPTVPTYAKGRWRATGAWQLSSSACITPASHVVIAGDTPQLGRCPRHVGIEKAFYTAVPCADLLDLGMHVFSRSFRIKIG